MSEWKEFKIDNLPKDILDGDYDFQWEHAGKLYEIFILDGDQLESMFRTIYEKQDRESSILRYRKSEAQTPTHEEIMTKWWKTENRGWQRVTRYFQGCKVPYYLSCHESISAQRLDKEWFIGKNSADIPPEAS